MSIIKRISVVFVPALCVSVLLTGCVKSTDAAVTETNMPERETAATTDIESTEDTDPIETTVEIKYKAGLAALLTEELDLASYDKEIEEIGYVPIDEEFWTDARQNGDMGLKFIYLRNNLNMYALSEEDRSILEENEIKAGEDCPKEILEVVSRTFPEIIPPTGAEKADMTYYDNATLGSTKPRFVTADTLVLRIAVSEKYDEAGNRTDPESAEEHEEELIALIDKMQGQFDSVLEVPISVQADIIS